MLRVGEFFDVLPHIKPKLPSKLVLQFVDVPADPQGIDCALAVIHDLIATVSKRKKRIVPRIVHTHRWPLADGDRSGQVHRRYDGSATALRRLVNYKKFG